MAPYDRLLIATGSDPIMLPVPGKDLPGVVTFRDLDDVGRMLAASESGRRAVVIGGGLLGLEAANGLRLRGMDVTVVHLMDTLMERQLDRAGGRAAASRSRETRHRVPHAREDAGAAWRRARHAVRFEGGETVPADLVVMAVGVRPNMELAKSAHLACDRGILVDDTLQSYDPSYLRGGRVRAASPSDVRPGRAAVGAGARVRAASSRKSACRASRGALTATQLKVSGIEVFSAGDFSEKGNRESWCSPTSAAASTSASFSKATRSAGAVLFGDTREAGRLRELIADGTDMGPIRDQLLFDSTAAA